MPKRLLILACILVAIHLTQALVFGVTPAGNLVANLTEVAASALAAVACFGASRRGRGMARSFWTLLAYGMVIWGVTNLAWAQHEFFHAARPSASSAIEFLFTVQGVFFALALFLDQDKESSVLDPETLLDFAQLAIIFFFVFLDVFYVPNVRLSGQSDSARRLWMEFGEELSILVLACIQWLRARPGQNRKLYAGFVAYFSIFTACAGLAEFRQHYRSTPTGTLFDLCWTLPFLWAAFWAARWQPQPFARPLREPPQKTLIGVALNNAIFVLAPLVVLVQVAQFPSELSVLRFSLLGLSILCFAARVGIRGYRFSQTSETVRRQALTMESAADGISIIGENGQHIYANSAFAQMMGYESPDAMLGLHWQEIYDPGDVRLWREGVREALNTQGRWFGQISLRRRDGTLLPVEMSVASLPNGVTACIGHDISARKEAEKARVEAESKFRMLIEQVAAISYIAELGTKGQWLYVSPQIEAITGYSAEEWLTQSQEWMRHVPPEDHPVIEAAEAGALRGQRFQAEYRIAKKDGSVVWVSDTAVVVPGSDSHPVMEGIIVDITERKQLETQLQQSRRVEAVGRLAGGIAHDFNNLLTIIRGYTELALQRPGIPPEMRADVMQVENAAERASVLVRQLLAFSRRQVLQPKIIDLNSIVVGLEKLLGRLIGENIQMVTRCAPDVGSVKADPSQVEQVIMNLVVNARDAMPKGGRLTVETLNVELDFTYARDHVTVKSGPYVMLAVSDTGIGMSPETMAHIFEPFFTTKGGGQGTGLGLSTVYGIVKQSGGYIWVYSEPGQGTAFKVYLPRVEEKAENKPEPATAPATKKGNETILLVEDEEAVRDLACMVLSAKGYTILRAENWREAEHLCTTHAAEIHLLLTDIVMPGLGGRELARRILVRRPRTRVLYMSGYTDSVLAQGGVLEEDVSFLQKPFTPAVLAQKVREVLDLPVPAR